MMRLQARSSVDLPQPDGTDHRRDLARGDHEVDVVERLEVAVPQAEVDDLDGGCVLVSQNDLERNRPCGESAERRR